MFVTTNLGFTYNTDEDVKVGTIVQVPTPKVSNPVKMKEAHVRFWATMYSKGLDWDNSILGEYNIGAKKEEIHPNLLNLSMPKLKIFVNAIFDAAGKPLLHKSGSGMAHIPEIWLNTKHRGVAEGWQFMLLRLGVRSMVRFNGLRGIWSLKVSGNRAVLALMKYLTNITNPVVLQKLDRVLKESGTDQYKPEWGVRDRVNMVSEFAPVKSRW